MMKGIGIINRGRFSPVKSLTSPCLHSNVSLVIFVSQRDSITQPRVASPRATLGMRDGDSSTLKGLEHRAATLSGLKRLWFAPTQGSSRTRNPGLNAPILSGLKTTDRGVRNEKLSSPLVPRREAREHPMFSARARKTAPVAGALPVLFQNSHSINPSC